MVAIKKIACKQNSWVNLVESQNELRDMVRNRSTEDKNSGKDKFLVEI